jgi:hypothetical protein
MPVIIELGIGIVPGRADPQLSTPPTFVVGLGLDSATAEFERLERDRERGGGVRDCNHFDRV